MIPRSSIIRRYRQPSARSSRARPTCLASLRMPTSVVGPARECVVFERSADHAPFSTRLDSAAVACVTIPETTTRCRPHDGPPHQRRGGLSDLRSLGRHEPANVLGLFTNTYVSLSIRFATASSPNGPRTTLDYEGNAGDRRVKEIRSTNTLAGGGRRSQRSPTRPASPATSRVNGSFGSDRWCHSACVGRPVAIGRSQLPSPLRLGRARADR